MINEEAIGDDVPSTANSEEQPPIQKKKRFIFKDEHDQLLLSDAWVKIEANLRRIGVEATSHSMQCRLRTLYETHLKEESESKAASGIEESFTEKKKLLCEYHDAVMDMKEAKKKQARSILIDEKNEAGGKALRHAAMEGMNKDPLDAKSDSKQAKVTLNSIFQAMHEAKSIENDMRKRELDIREKEIEANNELKRQRLDVDIKNAENQAKALLIQEQQLQLQAQMISMIQSLQSKEK
ncbi:hypothetical protein AC1031_020802 [Aphanomyces cochlioides]|nr:hypothetical protein AC1031_020802 [Aphanomyces cochlioides]